nr:acyl carrier protein [Micromonospora sp. DSM 115978]
MDDRVETPPSGEGHSPRPATTGPNGVVGGDRLDEAKLRQVLAVAGTAERETLLCEVVRAEAAEVLSKPSVTDDSNFMEQGLNSLTALQLTKNLMTLTGVEIPIVAIVEHPTPGELGRYLAQEIAGVDTAP